MMTSLEYGNDLQGSLLSIVHDICDHERLYGAGLSRSLQWQMDDIRLNPAFIDSAQVGANFKILSAVMQLEDGGMDLHVHNSSKRDIEDGDWYAEDFLCTFDSRWATHMQAEHELCIQALERQRASFTKLATLRSATTGQVLV